MVARYPGATTAGKPDSAAEATLGRVQVVVKAARALRAAKGLTVRDAAPLSVACTVRLSSDAHECACELQARRRQRIGAQQAACVSAQRCSPYQIVAFQC